MSGKAKAGKHVTDLLGDAARLAGQAAQFIRYCDRWAKSAGSENHLRSLSLYPPSQSRNGQWLVIGKLWSGGYKMVAFHRSSDPHTALVGFFQRWAEGKLDWKPDTWAEK